MGEAHILPLKNYTFFIRNKIVLSHLGLLLFRENNHKQKEHIQVKFVINVVIK